MLSFSASARKFNASHTLLLSEHCANGSQLEAALTYNSYESIVLNGCYNLEDNDLAPLLHLNHLKRLSIAGTSITGKCLQGILSINGLSELNISGINSLNLAHVKALLCQKLPQIKLKTLSLCGLPFDFYALKDIITIASQSTVSKIELGYLAHLSDERVLQLYSHITHLSTIEAFEVESNAFEGIENANMPLTPPQKISNHNNRNRPNPRRF